MGRAARANNSAAKRTVRRPDPKHVAFEKRLDAYRFEHAVLGIFAAFGLGPKKKADGDNVEAK